MPTELLRKEVERFLKTRDPEVICITGHWGVGKTYAWNRFLKDAQQESGGVALDRYAYVSLFGINSLEEFKFSIFENTVDSHLTAEPSLSTLQANAAALLKPLGRRAIRILQQLPAIKQRVGDVGSAWFLTVKESIVCIDDIERRGCGLEIRDVLGIVSKLREQKRCKVVLILNDEALNDSQREFDTFFEKVVDAKLQFAPTPVEAANIALSSATETGKLLSQYCVTLGISNIRVIKKIERSAKQLEEILEHFNRSVLRQAIQTLVLVSWSRYEPLIAPPIDFLASRISRFIRDPKKELPANEVAWNALLDVYDFSGLDEFDLAIVQGVQQGFFDVSSVQRYAAPLNTTSQMEAKRKPFKDAWALYHDSFDDNEKEFLQALESSFRAALDGLSPMDLNATMTIMKALGEAEMAAKLLGAYVSFHAADKSAFDLSQYPFASEINDPDLIEAFQTKVSTFVDERTALTVLQSIAEKQGWHEDDLKFLATIGPDQYYAIFKAQKGNELRRLIKTCVQFGTIADSPAMKQIYSRANEALARIGSETRVNALRVQKYGVTIGRDAPKT